VAEPSSAPAAARPLAGRVAVVTGGGRGLGRAIALAYAAAGARIVLAARTRAEIEQVAALATARGARALAVPTDVRDAAAVERLVAATLEAFGQIDVLVNNAGVGQGIAGRPIGSLLDVEPAVWDEIFAVNCRGPFLCARAALPAMLARGRGAIINITSELAWKVFPGTAPYGPTKAAVEQLTRIMAAEFGPRGVRVNALHPGGPVDTAIFGPNFPSTAPERLRPPELIGPAAVWLASDAAADVCGAVIDARAWNAEHGIAS